MQAAGKVTLNEVRVGVEVSSPLKLLRLVIIGRSRSLSGLGR